MIGEKLDFPAWFYGPQGGVFSLFNTVVAFGRRSCTFGYHTFSFFLHQWKACDVSFPLM
jgi:hypothetical protein